jgi:hypothetical protein
MPNARHCPRRQILTSGTYITVKDRIVKLNTEYQICIVSIHFTRQIRHYSVIKNDQGCCSFVMGRAFGEGGCI